MHNSNSAAISKVPEITLAFWVIKILATTLGETGGDAVSMSMELGYLVSTAIFAVIFFVSVSAQIAATSYNPLLYWTTIIATTTVGTTLADFADRSLGLGYAGGSTLLLALLMAPSCSGIGCRAASPPAALPPAHRAVLLGHHHVLPDAGHRTG